MRWDDEAHPPPICLLAYLLPRFYFTLFLTSLPTLGSMLKTEQKVNVNEKNGTAIDGLSALELFVSSNGISI